MPVSSPRNFLRFGVNEQGTCEKEEKKKHSEIRGRRCFSSSLKLILCHNDVTPYKQRCCNSVTLGSNYRPGASLFIKLTFSGLNRRSRFYHILCN